MPAAEVGGSSMLAAEVGGSPNEPEKVHLPLVWLCYAKSDANWVMALASSRCLKASLGDCETMDAIDDDGPSSLSLLDPLVAVIFISKTYFTENKPLWYMRLTDVQLKAVTFFPILTDAEARQWYSSLRFRNVGSQQSIDPIDFTGALGLRLDVRSDSPMIVARVTDLATTLNLLLDKLRRRRRGRPL